MLYLILCLACRRMHPQLLQLWSRLSPLPVVPGGMSPGRLFTSVYDKDLLRNSSFLERDNSMKGPNGDWAHAWVRVGKGGCHACLQHQAGLCSHSVLQLLCAEQFVNSGCISSSCFCISKLLQCSQEFQVLQLPGCCCIMTTGQHGWHCRLLFQLPPAVVILVLAVQAC